MSRPKLRARSCVSTRCATRLMGESRTTWVRAASAATMTASDRSAASGSAPAGTTPSGAQTCHDTAAAPAPVGRRASGPRLGRQSEHDTGQGGRQRFRGALQQRAAALQHQHRGGTLGLVDVGGREEHGGAECGLAGHEAPELSAADRIDTGGGLVEDQQVGTVQDGHGQGELLAHAAGELPGQAAGRRRQPRGGEELGGACAQRGAAQPVGAAGKGQVLGGGEVVIHAAGSGYVADASRRWSANVAGSGAQDAGHGAQQSGLAGAVAADDGRDLAAGQIEVDVLQCGTPAVLHRELGDAPGAGRHARPRRPV